MSHKLLEKIDDIVHDNRITEDEYITICSLLKDIHSQKNDVLINDLRDQNTELKYSIKWFNDERDEMIDELNDLYKSREGARDELNIISKSREVMVNLNRQLHKELKNVRYKFKQDIADKIIEISHLKKELLDLLDIYHPYDYFAVFHTPSNTIDITSFDKKDLQYSFDKCYHSVFIELFINKNE